MKRILGLLASLMLLASVAQAQIPTVTVYNAESVPAALTAAQTADGGGNNCTAGAHLFAVTVVVPLNQTGTQPNAETGLSNGSASVTCDGTHTEASLSAIPVGSQFATARNIYATKAGGTIYYYVTTINDNTTTTFTFNTADAGLVQQYPQSGYRGAMPLKPMYNLVNNEIQPIGAAKIKLGDATNTFLSFNSVTMPTTGAGAIATGVTCGASLAAAGACPNTNPAGTFHMVYGTFLLSGSTSTVTGISPAFTSSTSWACVANDITTRANPVQAIPSSGTAVVITNTTGATDLISMICMGN